MSWRMLFNLAFLLTRQRQKEKESAEADWEGGKT
ncbi:hypothetical protein ES288_D07G197600v1 [Gossypium darwinii]|uniref:Uncharacterized protein n=1 Tax=Gossypium darwinii TaxID=34276 RepID=A0A5D2BYE6_GOSDA|nr:hypothetical protein ES288_D07G197600v1 [Gossypium darwinii]